MGSPNPPKGNQVRHILIVFSIFLFSFTIISCAKKSSDDSSSTTDDTNTTKDSIYENFNDNTINENLWKIDNEDKQLVKEVDSQLSIVNSSTENENNCCAYLYLKEGGYREIQVDIKIDSWSSPSNASLFWYPWNNSELVHLGFASEESSNTITTFAQIWSEKEQTIYLKRFGTASLNSYYTFKMVWDGNSVFFFIDNVSKDSYSPPTNKKILNSPNDIRINSWRNENDNGSIKIYADNFYANP